MLWRQVLVIVGLNMASYLVGVWIGSRTRYKEYTSLFGPEATTRPDTPRVKITRYQRFINASRRTLRLKEWDALRLRKRVQLKYRDTERIPDDELITPDHRHRKND